jgi:glc operon protein GlcG
MPAVASPIAPSQQEFKQIMPTSTPNRIFRGCTPCTALLALVCLSNHGDNGAYGQAPGAATSTAPLVTRDRIGLSLAGADLIIAHAKIKGAEMQLKLNIAVVDDGGHLLAFARMDGARPASAYTAMTKAVSTATMRQPTGPVRRGDADPDVLLNVSLQNAAAAGGAKITTLYGGLPVIVDGQVIGGVGVGGGTGEQDAEVARAGIDALVKSLAKR